MARSTQALGYRVEVISLALKPAVYAAARERRQLLEREYGIPICVLPGIHGAIPLSVLVNGLLLAGLLAVTGRRRGVIHARTEYSAAVACAAARACGFSIIWDCRGDLLAEHAAKWRHGQGLFGSLLRWTGSIRVKRLRRAAARGARCAFFVSDALRSQIAEAAAVERTEVLANGANKNLFYFSASLRETMRRGLSLRRGQILLVYAGSTAPWQEISQLTRLASELLRNNGGARFLVLSDNAAAIRDAFAPEVRSQVMTRFVALGEVNAYLNAADLALMFKQDDPLSWVASPVKFAEYALAGLPVFHNGTVAQIVAYGNALGNAFPVSRLRSVALEECVLATSERTSMANRCREVLSNERRIEQLDRCYASLPGS